MNTRISTLAIVCTLGISMSSFAAPSVRTLGGASTYSSAASAASGSAPTASAPTRVKAPASSNKTTSGENLRGGAMRVDSGSTIGGTRVSSSRAASAPRLSIGKYLTTGQSVSGGSSAPSNPRPSTPSPDECDACGDIKNLYDLVADIQNEFNSYMDKDYTFSYNDTTGMLKVTDGTNVLLEEKMVTETDLTNLENKLNEYIAEVYAELTEQISSKQDMLTPENLKGEGNVTIGFNNGVITVTGAGSDVENVQEKLIPGTAISIDDTTDVISVNVGSGLYVDAETNTLNATVSEGAIYEGDTGITVDNIAHKIALALKAGNGIKVDGATVALDTPDDSGNYFYSVSGPGTGDWIPFAVVDASALETTATTTVVEEPVAE